MIGYNSIPSTVPVGPLPEPQVHSWFAREYEVRDILIGAGLNEIVTYTITSRARMVNLLAQADASSARFLLQAATTDSRGRAGPYPAPAGPYPAPATSTAVASFDARSLPAVTLVNPPSSDLESMRLTLMSGLLETVQEDNSSPGEEEVDDPIDVRSTFLA